jgi:histidinol-phosphatase (PHP family)
VWRIYFDALATLASSGCVDVLAHPDLAKKLSRRPADPAAFYPQLDAVALEISTAGLRKPVRELYPDPALLGGCPITLASDAHVPELVGAEFEQALELARSAGYDTVTVFEGRVARQEPLG